MQRRSALFFAGLLCFALVVRFTPAQAAEVGLFFDENAETCVESIENFGPGVKIFVFAFAPSGVTLNGASLRLELPAGIVVANEQEPRDGQNTLTGNIDASLGVDVTLSPCVPGGGPVLLMSFELSHFDPSDPSAHFEDLELKLRGGTIVADSLDLVEPNLKICDPDDPLGGEFELQEAVSLRATLNCTTECPCTTAIRQRTWADFKRLYLKP